MQKLSSLLVATRNVHKIEEIQAILGSGIQYLSLKDLPGAPEVVEDGPTFAANATKKAVTLAQWLSGLARGEMLAEYVLADDSGLEVDALNLAPGVHSARFAALDTGAKGNSPDRENNAKLLRLLQEVPAGKRAARFRCVIALAPVFQERGLASQPCAANPWEMRTELFSGTCEGTIGFEPRGENGFGYDPLFIPTGYDKTFAEMGDETKNALSHRAKALGELKKRFAA